MANRFPHMSDTNFPDVQNVDAFKYRNEFDYSKYNRTQMRITICSVPWDVGLIHVGNAQIGGLGNVVYFESPDARDEYLNSIENKFTWETKYRAYHDDGYIEVPLPYEKCVLFNYCYIEYDTLPVDWGTGGKNKFFFFIRSCEYLAPNTSKIEILRDTWQTYIYDVNITNMMLERGHAPLSIIDADRYLANPIGNTGYLLAEDVNYGGAMRPKYASNIVLNSENMQAVIVTSGNLSDAWGAKGSGAWVTPGDTKMLDGVSSYHAYAIDAENLSGFLTYVKNNLPQFPQTVQGVFFVSGEFLDFVGQAIRIWQYSLFEVEQQTKELDLLELTKSQFGYGAKYEDLAKLYTYPYAYLEVSDENGNKQQLRIEETSGNLSLTVTTNLAYPFMKINAHMGGIGEGAGAVTFANADSHTFNFDGRWYDYLYEWDIPSFAVIQSNSDYYDFSTYYDREQRAFEIDTAYRNALDSADVSKTNADASANTTKTNADASANVSKTNADASANTAKTNADASALSANANALAANSNTKTNADAKADTAFANATRDYNTAYDDATANNATSEYNAKRSAQASKDAAYADSTSRLDIANVRSYVTAQNNFDSNETAKANSDASATTAYNNAVSANAQARANTNANSETTYWNTYNINRDSVTANAALQRTANNNIRTAADNTIRNKTATNNNKLESDYWNDVALNLTIAAEDAANDLAVSQLNSAASIASGAVQGALTGAAGGMMLGIAGGGVGAVAGAASGALGATANAAISTASLAITISKDADVVAAATRAARSKTTVAQDTATTLDTYEIQFQNSQVAYQNTLNRETTENSVNASNAAASATHNTTVANANATESTNNAIAVNALSTTNANTNRTKNTNDGNATRTFNSETAFDEPFSETGKYGTNYIEYWNYRNKADIAKTAADANAEATKATADANAIRNRDANRDNAVASRDLAKSIINPNDKSTADEIANRTKATANENSSRTNATDLTNNARTLNASLTNNARTLETSLANNERSYGLAYSVAERNLDAGLEGIENDIRQAALKAPKVFGAVSDAETATSRPQGLFCNIITQAQDAIEQTGDYFLRFGYAVNRAWEFETFNLMPHFTYWKASDMWLSGNNVPDKYLDEIRFYLLGGVCVWRNPADIGKITIYENR